MEETVADAAPGAAGLAEADLGRMVAATEVAQ
jgi:predicted transcriptional regulator